MKQLLAIAALVISTSAFSAEGKANLIVSVTVVDSCSISSTDRAVSVRCGSGTTSRVIPETGRYVMSDGITITTVIDERTKITTIMF